MDDSLSKLQLRLDQLNTQLYASLRYISTHHSAPQLPPSPTLPAATADPQPAQLSASAPVLSNGQAQSPSPQPPPQPQSHAPTAPPAAGNAATAAAEEAAAQEITIEIHGIDASDIFPPDQQPDSPGTFAAAQKELAHDLILKSKQIEELIRGMPGIGRGKVEQEERIRELEEELQGVLKEREEVEVDRKEWVRRVEGLICGM